MSAHAYVLPNGLRVITAEDPLSPAVAAGFWVRAGVCDEPADRRGIAHFLEHMMFRGSENFPPEAHSKRIARLGGDCNAYTDHDATVFHETIPPSALEEVFRLESDRFRRLQLEQDLTDTERKVILEELRVYMNQPMVRAGRLIAAAVGGDHPYALDPLGRREDLEALTVEDLRAFHRRRYRPENMFIVVTGGVRETEVRELAQKWFGDWEPAAIKPDPPATRWRPQTGVMSLRVSFEVPIVANLHRLSPPSEEDLPALGLLTALLTDGETAPLRERLVRKTRLCVEAGGVPMKMRNGGLLLLFGVFLPPGGHAARRRLMKEICARMADEGPDHSRFEMHLKQFRKDLAQAVYSPSRRMTGLGQAELLEDDFRLYERRLEALSSVTPERVRDLARRLFAPENTLELDLHPEKSPWWMWPAGLASRMWPR
jgi:zinc protease